VETQLSIVDTCMIIIMSFISTVVVHISVTSVVRTFVHSYMLLILPTVLLGFHESYYKVRGYLPF